jgi:hypothetical protein
MCFWWRQDQGKEVVLGNTRLENRESLIAEIEAVKPTHILDAAGITGRYGRQKTPQDSLDT